MVQRIFICLLASLFLFTADISAQSSKKRMSKKEMAARKKREAEEDRLPFKDRLTYTIRLGNVGINSGFSLSAKPGVGYNISKYFEAGLGSKIYYDYDTYYDRSGISLFTYGGFAYARAKFKIIYIQGEYGQMSFQNFYTNGQRLRTVVTYPSVGAGYLSGDSKWKYGLELVLPVNADARYYGVPLEYWFNITYNF